MGNVSFKHFEKGDRVYFVSELAQKLAHLQGTLMADVTPDTREIRLLNDDGDEIRVGSRISPEWSMIEAVEGFGLLFLKMDAERVVYVVVSENEDGVMLEPDLYD